jgi:hypothetical protein
VLLERKTQKKSVFLEKKTNDVGVLLLGLSLCLDSGSPLIQSQIKLLSH